MIVLPIYLMINTAGAVRPSVRPSHFGVLSRWMKIRPWRHWVTHVA